jgi:hypothetical protein
VVEELKDTVKENDLGNVKAYRNRDSEVEGIVEQGIMEEEEEGDIQKERENAEDIDIVVDVVDIDVVDVDVVDDAAENDRGYCIVVLDKPSLLKS